MGESETKENRLPASYDKVQTLALKQRPNCFAGFCRLVNFFTVVCALLCAVAHGMALMVGEGGVQASPAFSYLLRVNGLNFWGLRKTMGTSATASVQETLVNE